MGEKDDDKPCPLMMLAIYSDGGLIMRIVLVLASLLLLTSLSQAQTTIAVDINRAKLLWDMPVGGGAPSLKQPML